ncbi:MAG: tRNA epoxyqueuosine(34) reductase QueG [Bacteroidaceae bacterium]
MTTSSTNLKPPTPSSEEPLQALSIKTEALRLGFSACGIVKAERVNAVAEQELQLYLSEGRQAEMHYLENYTDKRLDPRLLVEGAQTLLSVALNYYPSLRLDADQLQFAYYAYGKDYHVVVKEKLNALLTFIQQQRPDILGRAFCDTAPILERYWAWRSGIGWIGKNKQLLLPHHGSYFFLGELLLTAPCDHYDTPIPSFCGSCHACIEACPATLCNGPSPLCKENEQKESWVNCLSYLTIEHRGEIPEMAKKGMGNTIYGCDQCQKVCPHNRFARPTSVSDFAPTTDFLKMQPKEWEQLTKLQYTTLFKGSAVKRTKYEGLIRNIKAIHSPSEIVIDLGEN